MSNDIPTHYWQNLLAITTKAQAEDPTKGSNDSDIPKVLNDESRQWLETVMKDLVNETDPFRQLQSVINSLHPYAAQPDSINEEDENKILSLCDRLDELLSIADLSMQFINNGGILILETMILFSNNDEIRKAFSQVILTWSENNEVAQTAIVENGLLEKLVDLICNPDLKQTVLSSVLSSISGVVRSNTTSFKKFLSYNGPEKFMKLIEHHENQSICAKCARILTSMSYTMQDQGELAKMLTNFIMQAYFILISYEKNFAELEYIREFILNYVMWNDINEDERLKFLTKLDEESRRNLDETNEDLITRLRKKFAALRNG